MLCEPGQALSVDGALDLLERALDALITADHARLPAGMQARALRELERAESRQTAVRGAVLAAFTARSGYEDDGQGSAYAWLRWQTRVTGVAARTSVGWARRLAAHPAVAGALAAGELSVSWAQEMCGWTDKLPAGHRDGAEQILLAAAAGGADLADLARLAQEMYERSRQDQPDDGDDGVGERYFRLGVTFGGAGRAEGDLTPGCAAALSAVLEALGRKAGPEDARSAGQRRHDALEEACRRLVAARMIPGRAGQPTQIQVHLSLAQLRSLPGAAAIEHAWLDGAAAQPGWLAGPAADAATCDATINPVVTGHIDWAALDQLTGLYLGSAGMPPGCGCTCGGCPGHPGPLSGATRQRVRRTLLALAVDALSGPAGLAAALRANPVLGAPLSTPSLPLDVGTAADAVPAHLRRAAVLRHPVCGFPGCGVPASACEIHHLIRRADGGPTSLRSLIPLCKFHHLIVIHTWGWRLRLSPDGTTTAISPEGRVHHSHGPPPAQRA